MTYISPLVSQELSDAAVVHALKVRKAVALGNYHALAKLYKSAPNLGHLIMDQFIDQERVKSLQSMMKG
jgi:hypothetical protein